MTHGYLPRRNIQYHLRNKERIETRRTITFCKVGNLFLKSNQSPDTACEYNTDPVNIYIFPADASVFNRFVACHQGSLCEPVDLSRLFLFQKIKRIKILYLAGKLRFKF